MSTNKSEHLNLHLWEPEDDFLRTEFNENFEKIDTLAGKAYTSSCKPYKIGHYTGTGAEQTIKVGFQPSFLIISGMKESILGNDIGQWANYSGYTAGNLLTERVTLTETGFTVKGGSTYPNLDENGRGYDYIAFH